MLTSQQIRSKFISFFESKQHQYVVPSPVVPEADSSLLFINAGMNQFKDVFLGQSTRPYVRAVNSQPCIRVSGKHNDLEDVGFDSTHLTSFEMLGNWSFGDYYKKEAITWAWECFTKEFNLTKEKLVATVFEDDAESRALWQECTDIKLDQIVSCDAKDNFWEMGATGPCGPCSEIHVYLKDGPLPSPLTQETLNNGDFIELWNLVFIQYNRLADQSLEPLDQQHVDTGAGLERLVAYLQGTPSNYETDLFKPIIKRIEVLSGISYEETDQGMPHRVCADHIRTLCFGIADNVHLSNEGRGYVLRRLLRRACRYAKQLGFDKPVLYKCVESVIETLGETYTHIKDRQDYIQRVIKAEEESFLQTLQQGLVRFDELLASLKQENATRIQGGDAFRLYDTFGFPLDLTQMLAKEQGLTVDIDAFNKCLTNQRERSRNAASFDSSINTKSMVKPEQFAACNLHLAEDLNVAKGGEARIISDPKEKVSMAMHHSATHILHECLRKCVGEHVQQAGSLVDSQRLRFDFSHFEKVDDDTLKTIELIANEMVAQGLSIHVSTMTLAAAKQQGAIALFGEKYDPKAVRVVNIGGQSIECCAGTHVKNTNQIEAIKIISESAISAGSRRLEAIVGYDMIATFYDDEISLIQQDMSSKCKQVSKQFTHLRLNRQQQEDFDQYNQLANQAVPKELKDKAILAQQLKKAHPSFKKLIKVIKKISQVKPVGNDLIDQLNKNSQQLENGTPVVVKQLDQMEIPSLRSLADQWTATHSKGIAVLISKKNNQGQLVVKAGSQLQSETFNAQDLINQITATHGGGGGGRKMMAQAGGVNLNQVESVIQLVQSYLKTYV